MPPLSSCKEAALERSCRIHFRKSGLFLRRLFLLRPGLPDISLIIVIGAVSLAGLAALVFSRHMPPTAIGDGFGTRIAKDV
jgi:hypothetical protein